MPIKVAYFEKGSKNTTVMSPVVITDRTGNGFGSTYLKKPAKVGYHSGFHLHQIKFDKVSKWMASVYSVSEVDEEIEKVAVDVGDIRRDVEEGLDAVITALGNVRADLVDDKDFLDQIVTAVIARLGDTQAEG